MTLTLEPVTRGGTILFVDDEPLSLKYFKASVGKYAKVLTASSPDAALKILASDGDAISVVVSDERMPFESGVSFLSDVRKSWPSTVRILTSAYANIDNLQQAINGAAIYRFVPKPWDLDELCTAMQEALAAERAAEKLATFRGQPVRRTRQVQRRTASQHRVADGSRAGTRGAVGFNRQGSLSARHADRDKGD